jgi:hypothetical protein
MEEDYIGSQCPKTTAALNLLKTKRRLIYLKTQSVPRCKTLFNSVIKTKKFMVEVTQVAVCSQINSKHK